MSSSAHIHVPGIPGRRTGTGSILMAAALALTACAGDPPDPSRYPLIPLPAEVEPAEGEFTAGPETRVLLPEGTGQELRQVVERWAEGIRRSSGLRLPVATGGAGSGAILIRLDEPETGGSPAPGEGLPGVRAESYHLEVEEAGVTLKAHGLPGIFYGLETLRQLMEEPSRSPGAASGSSASAPSIPAVEIDDEPRFSYRGMHLDVGRHFFPVESVKRYLDYLAAFKMNVFHWHLTEDQGWRIEIQAFPRLTEVGGCRAETILEKNFDPYVGDGTPHCGFYTQDQIREVVAYARERFITVIPEIEMPGHSVAALAAYPELACTDGPFQVATRWGVTRDIFCPKEETFRFLETVLSEVMNLFPGPYIHIGGDEAPKDRWQESPVAQEVISREGLADEDELQSWFIRRIEAFLNRNGRNLIGWDEILEGGLAPNATVMSWRGVAGGLEAASRGHDVIMTPNSHLYLDYYQGDTLQEPLAIGGFSPLERVYGFEPVPADLGRDKAHYILGAQGNVWTEYMATWDHVEYMVLPRLLALSEVVWSPENVRDWDHFLGRLPARLRQLDRMDASYRIPDVYGLEDDRLILGDSVLVELSAPAPAGEVRYTLDGLDPGPGDPIYEGPFLLYPEPSGTEIRARVLLPDGRGGAVRSAILRRTELKPATSLPRGRRVQGLLGRILPGSFPSVDSIPEVITENPGAIRRARVARVQIPAESPGATFGVILDGYIRIPRDGIYTFFLSSDDGSSLELDGNLVVDNDGYHGMEEGRGQAALRRGWHPLRVRYFQGGGGAGLELELEGPHTARRPVPAHWLAHPRTDGR